MPNTHTRVSERLVTGARLLDIYFNCYVSTARGVIKNSELKGGSRTELVFLFVTTVSKYLKKITIFKYETSRLPHFLDTRLTDGGEIVGLTRLPLFTLRKIPGTLLERELIPGP
jgi:hypothetical protein